VAKYTIELRSILDLETQFPPNEDALALKNILANYPLENENFLDLSRKDGKTRREVLNDKILNHYYFSEIGFETIPRFLFALKRRLDEKMTLYNQRYKSIDLDINPINNVDMTESFTHTITGSGSIDTNNTDTNTGTIKNDGSGTSSSTNDNLNVGSDTPPTELLEADILANKFASTTAHDKNTASGESTSTNTQTLNTTNHLIGDINTTDNKSETYERKEFGSSKGYTFAQNIDQWRNIMLNIEEEIINELSDLFMNVW